MHLLDAEHEGREVLLVGDVLAVEQVFEHVHHVVPLVLEQLLPLEVVLLFHDVVEILHFGLVDFIPPVEIAPLVASVPHLSLELLLQPLLVVFDGVGLCL